MAEDDEDEPGVSADEKGLYEEAKQLKIKKYGRRLIIKAVEEKGRMLIMDSHYDKPYNVLKFAYGKIIDHINYGEEIKFLSIEPESYDFIVIGCDAQTLPQKERLRGYVEKGGWILTTDWALKTVVEQVFPGTIEFNQNETSNAVVPCQIVQPLHPFLIGVVDSLVKIKDETEIETLGTSDFRWWLEGSSYPIRIVDKENVHVLIESREIKEKWGEGPVFVYFKFGKGVVLHFISHAHLQQGGSKGKFASALMITNIFDECIRSKYGIPTEVQ